VCDGLPVVGTLDNLDETLHAVGARAIVIATSDVAVKHLPRLVELADRGIEVRTSAAFRNTTPGRVAVDSLDGIPLVAVRQRRLTRVQQATKRLLDIVLALAFVSVLVPLFVAIAVAVRTMSGRGVIFRQRRVGEGGKTFTIYKFRTMIHGAEEMLEQLQAKNEAEGLLFKLEHDPRVTPLGRFLRRSALDELPQLWNVLKGDMSMVGPRPPLVREVERYDDGLTHRLDVKPGLTGLWQVSGRHELQFDDYVRYDLFYVNNWSVGLDLMICARTVPALLNRRGSY
jgi:exopolysaccharide biosynthesis polyprenyl glycosylphosphotransferase